MIHRLKITIGVLLIIAGGLSGQGVGPWFPMPGPWCTQKIIDIAVSNADPPVIYVVNEGNTEIGGALAKSTDGGSSWHEIGNFTHVRSVASINSDELYISAKGPQGRGIYQIQNNDISFLSNLSARKIVIGPDGRVYVLTDRGVFVYQRGELSDESY